MQDGREVILQKNFSGYFHRENAQTVRCKSRGRVLQRKKNFAEKKKIFALQKFILQRITETEGVSGMKKSF